MALQEKNKIYIDKEALSALSLVQEGLLYPVITLMNQKEMEEVNKTGLYKNQSFPCPFLLSPSGKRNHEVLSRIKKGETLEIISEKKIVGEITAEEIYKIDKLQRLEKIMGGGDLSTQEADMTLQRLGEYAISGKYNVIFEDIKIAKKTLEQKINLLSAKKITGVMMSAKPFHRAHERMLREELDDCDLLVIFLLKPYKKDLMDYRLRKKCMQYIANNFLIKDKICIIPLDDTYLFAGQNKMILHAIVAKNYGCTKLIVGQNTPNLSIYYTGNVRHSVFDRLEGVNIETEIINEYVYCSLCKTIVSKSTCPHGHHYHTNYNAESILELLGLGILPPSILVREEISAMILSCFYPNRFSNLKKLYYDLVPSDGILNNKNEEEFYIQLMQLYQNSFQR
ncbi:sulfate adenylyltransferase [Helicobacter sp. 12S02232-10]|uniref:sulfate adenylyltransferase n=1 Tax=Helicobacter sp. 12S02232-10 TaxID=1476197 RepID=UPI000BA5D7B8|nr:sulfate adenylyltransferase [Helicobacter sp. 12S02232-10]PAF48911.1 sulfate adenylyltransferase [Helicobacter sp. 12S02232-10]